MSIMKKGILAACVCAATLLSGCSSSFMENAVVADINGRTIVLFPDVKLNGVQYYKPQHASDCQVEFAYGIDETSTACRIREDRLSNVHSYKEHLKHPVHLVPVPSSTYKYSINDDGKGVIGNE